MTAGRESSFSRTSSLARQWAVRVCAAILLSVAGAAAIHSVREGTRTLRLGAESTGTEAAQPLLSAKLLAGEDLYGSWDSYPYEIALYGPLTYAVPAAVAHTLGLAGSGIWIAGRGVSLLAGVLVLVLGASALRVRGVRWWLVTLGVLLLVPTLRIWNAAFTFRPDLPAIALSLAGLLVARRGGVAAVPLLIAAVAWKQTAVAVPLALGLSFLLRGDRRGFARFGGTYATALLVYVAAMIWSTQGNFVDHAARALDAPYLPSLAFAGTGRILEVAPLACLAGLGWAVRALWRRSADPLPWCGVVSLLLAILSAGRVGADVNYFLEAILYLQLSAVLAAEATLRGIGSRPVLPVRNATLALCLGVSLLSVDRAEDSRFPLRGAPPFDVMEGFFGDLAEELGTNMIFPGDLGAAVIGGYPHPYSDGFLVDYLVKTGRLRDEDLVGHVRQFPYQYVLLPETPVRYQGYGFIPDAVAQDLLTRFDLGRARTLSPPLGSWRYLLLPQRTLPER